MLNSASSLIGISLLGPVNNGINQSNTYGHSLGDAFSAGSVYTITFQGYAQSAPVVTHDTGLGFVNMAEVDIGTLSVGVLWVPFKQTSGQLGWYFNPYMLTGNNADSEFILGGYDSVQQLSIVIDAIKLETYGIYNFGSGVQETAHYSFSNSQLGLLDGVGGFADYRGANGGSTTAQGDAYLPTEFDDIMVSENKSVPLPSTFLLLITVAFIFGKKTKYYVRTLSLRCFEWFRDEILFTFHSKALRHNVAVK